MQVLLYQAVTSTPSEYFMLCSSLCRPPFFLSCLFKMYRISFHSPNYENESGSQNAKQTQQHKMGKNELNSCDSKTWNLGVFENQIKNFFLLDKSEEIQLYFGWVDEKKNICDMPFRVAKVNIVMPSGSWLISVKNSTKDTYNTQWFSISNESFIKIPDILLQTISKISIVKHSK